MFYRKTTSIMLTLSLIFSTAVPDCAWALRPAAARTTAIIDFNGINGSYVEQLRERAEVLIKNAKVAANGEAELVSQKLWGKRFSIVALKDHSSAEAIRIFLDKIAPELMELEPEKIMFLIEKPQFTTFPEAQIFERFAEDLGIMTDNPIAPPYNYAAAMFAGMEPLEAAKATMLVEHHKYVRRTQDSSPSAFGEFWQVCADMFCVSKERLGRERIAIETPEDREEALREAQQTVDKLVQVSNDFSNGITHMLVEHSPEVTRVVALIGNAHLPAFDEDYKPRFTLSRKQVLDGTEMMRVAESDSALVASGIDFTNLSTSVLREAYREIDSGIPQVLQQALDEITDDKDFKTAVRKLQQYLFDRGRKFSHRAIEAILKFEGRLPHALGISALIREIIDTEGRTAPVFSVDEINQVKAYLEELAEGWPENRELLNILAEHSYELIILYHRLYQAEKQYRERCSLEIPKCIIARWREELQPPLVWQDFEISSHLPAEFQQALIKWYRNRHLFVKGPANPKIWEEAALRHERKGEFAAAGLDRVWQAAHLIKAELGQDPSIANRAKVAPRIKLILKKAARLRREYKEPEHKELSILAEYAFILVEILANKYGYTPGDLLADEGEPATDTDKTCPVIDMIQGDRDRKRQIETSA